ncbi:MAG: 3-oxoacyl-ACP reductase FabG [Oscillibacter sp.]|nr:3-oxoacyl-ACP reductase FabG [Oscillibacter sp.]
MKTALVTGASRGIGAAIAEELARRGWAVGLNYRESRASAEALAERLRAEGFSALALCADVSDAAAVERMVETLGRELSAPDLLVNNAGVSYHGVFQNMTDAEWERCFAVNVGGARNAIRAVLPHMLTEKRGSVVNVASIWGLRGASCEVAYSCTKAALVALTRSLALELAPSGIRVNCVAPGVIDTDMMRALGEDVARSLAEQTPLGRLGTPRDVARAVAFLAGEDAAFLTGQVLTADGGFTV